MLSPLDVAFARTAFQLVSGAELALQVREGGRELTEIHRGWLEDFIEAIQTYDLLENTRRIWERQVHEPAIQHPDGETGTMNLVVDALGLSVEVCQRVRAVEGKNISLNESGKIRKVISTLTSAAELFSIMHTRALQ